jgi:hypothetical protein
MNGRRQVPEADVALPLLSRCLGFKPGHPPETMRKVLTDLSRVFCICQRRRSRLLARRDPPLNSGSDAASLACRQPIPEVAG